MSPAKTKQELETLKRNLEPLRASTVSGVLTNRTQRGVTRRFKASSSTFSQTTVTARWA